MGVGAIFVSTLAIHRLPEPHSPAETQQDILASALHPVVGFVVLVSIIVRKFALLPLSLLVQTGTVQMVCQFLSSAPEKTYTTTP